MRTYEAIYTELMGVCGTPKLDVEKLAELHAEAHAICDAEEAAAVAERDAEYAAIEARRVSAVAAAVAASKARLARLRNPGCAICGDTRPQEGWTCPGCGSI